MREVLFRLGPISVYSYGFFLALGFLAGTALAVARARKAGKEWEPVVDLALCVCVGALVGSRLLYVALEWPSYAGDIRQVFEWPAAGLSFHGGLLGGMGAAFLFVRWRRMPFWATADLVAPSIALGYAIARIGCFLRGCCYGYPSLVPWAVVFDGIGRHPTQLYLLAGSLAIAFVLLRLEKSRHFDGWLFLAYLVLYSVVRIGVEVVRESQVLAFGWLKTAQVGSLVVIACALAIGAILGRRNRDGG